MLVPWVPCPDKSPYHPPHPKACWKFAGFQVLENGQVACKCNKEAKRILSQYTLIHFLQERYREGFQAYLNEGLRPAEYEYRPHRLKRPLESFSRTRDPLKMVVFYDNNSCNYFPLAVCLLLRDKQGAFALVDDFGKVMTGTIFMFTVVVPMERRIQVEGGHMTSWD